jgi:hypothetical protein
MQIHTLPAQRGASLWIVDPNTEVCFHFWSTLVEKEGGYQT